MLDFKITVPPAAKEIPARLLAEKRAALERGVQRAGQRLVGALKEQSLRGALHGRTGTLSRSWAAGTAVSSHLGITLAVGSPMVYAAILEHGGEIRPVKAKALTIPFAANVEGRERGPLYKTVDALKQAMGSKNVFTLKNGSKAPLIMAKTGKSDRSIKPFFVLAPKATIPAKRYVSIAVENASPKVTAEISNALAASGGK